MNSASNPFMNGEVSKVNWWNWANTEDYDFKAIHKVGNYPENQTSTNGSEEDKVEISEIFEKHAPKETIKEADENEDSDVEAKSPQWKWRRNSMPRI